jgi:hypothetical protein
VRLTPSQNKIRELLANKVFKGKIYVRNNANKYIYKADNHAPKCRSLKENINKYFKLKNYYELLFKKIEIDEMINTKSTLLLQINQQIKQLTNELNTMKKLVYNEKKIRKKITYDKVKKELKITELNNKIKNLQSKVDQAKNIAQSQIKKEFKLNHAEIESNLRRQQELLSQTIAKKKDIIQHQRAIIKKNKESEYYYDDNADDEIHCHLDDDSD